MLLANLITPIKFSFSAGQYHIADKAGNHYYSTDSFLDALRAISYLERASEEEISHGLYEYVEIPF